MAEASRTSRVAFRSASAVFVAATAFFAFQFVYEIVDKNEIRTGVLTYGLITLLTAIGLWLVTSWGRSLALLISLATAGLGVLTLLSVIIARDGSPYVPVIVLVASGAMAFWLSRPAFNTPVGE